MTEKIQAQVHQLNSMLSTSSPDVSKCKVLLTELKIALTQLPLLPSIQPPLPTATVQQITLARDVYEAAAFVSILDKDSLSFERHLAQSKSYYMDYASVLPPSASQYRLLGLNLLRLVAQNRIAEFHTEIELLPLNTVKENHYIQFPIKMEQYLTEGSYPRIMGEKDQIPDPYFGFFFCVLVDTVREEIITCTEKAYSELSVDYIMQILSLTSAQELNDVAERKGWLIMDSMVYFEDKSKNTKDENRLDVHVPTMDFIGRSINYAKELERIV